MILAIQTSYKKTGFGQTTAELIEKYRKKEKKLNTKIAKLVNQINEAKKKLGEPPLKEAFYLIQEIYNKTLQSLPPKETVSPEKYRKLYYETYLKNLQKLYEDLQTKAREYAIKLAEKEKEVLLKKAKPPTQVIPITTPTKPIEKKKIEIEEMPEVEIPKTEIKIPKTEVETPEITVTPPITKPPVEPIKPVVEKPEVVTKAAIPVSIPRTFKTATLLEKLKTPEGITLAILLGYLIYQNLIKK